MTATILGLIFGVIAGAIVGGVIAGCIASSYEVTGWGLFGSILLGIVGGGLIGAGIGALFGAAIGAAFPGINAALANGFLLPMLSGGIGETLAWSAVAVSAADVSAAATAIVVAAGAAVGTGIAMMSGKPSSGPIRFSGDQGIGIDPETGKMAANSERANEIYRTIKDKKLRAKWKKWLKGKGWRRSHFN